MLLPYFKRSGAHGAHFGGVTLGDVCLNGRGLKPIPHTEPQHNGWKWLYGWPELYKKTCFTHNFVKRGPITMKLYIGIEVSFVDHLVTQKRRCSVTSRICDVTIANMS